MVRQAITCFVVITLWWLFFLGLMSPPPTQPIIPWAVDGPMYLYLEDPFQTSQEIVIREGENEQAKQFFNGLNRNPFKKLIYSREEI